MAAAIEQCLKAQGFLVTKGQLEVFPNTKTFGVDRKVEYNGRRLPIQPRSGSCLLDDDLNPISDRLEDFLEDWDRAAAGQDLDLLKEAIPHAREARKHERYQRSLSPTAETWKAELEGELAEGWTGHGQTNHLLKTIACHAIVFEYIEAI